MLYTMRRTTTTRHLYSLPQRLLSVSFDVTMSLWNRTVNNATALYNRTTLGTAPLTTYTLCNSSSNSYTAPWHLPNCKQGPSSSSTTMRLSFISTAAASWQPAVLRNNNSLPSTLKLMRPPWQKATTTKTPLRKVSTSSWLPNANNRGSSSSSSSDASGLGHRHCLNSTSTRLMSSSTASSNVSSTAKPSITPTAASTTTTSTTNTPTSSSPNNDYPSFKVSRISYADGRVETMNLDTSELMRATSLYARDLFFTLNLTSRQERYRASGSSSSNSAAAASAQSDENGSSASTTATSTAAQSLPIVPRRTVSVIQSRIKTNTILLSFGKLQAVVNLHYIYLLNAHNPSVRDFAHYLSSMFQNQNADCQASATSTTMSSSVVYALMNDESSTTTALANSEAVGTGTSSPTVSVSGSSASGEPNELIFLECCLRDTVDSYFRRLRLFEPIVDSILEKVDQADVTSPDSVVYQLAPLKDALQSFEIQVRQSLECLENILNRDDEMLGLLLTEHYLAQTTGDAVDFARHEHVELLLGVYARQISTLHSEIQHVLQRLQSKQEFVTLALSSHRNRMVQMNVHLGIAGLSIGFSTAVAGFFGMNLISSYEASATAWLSVVLLSSLGSLGLSLLSLNHLSGETMRRRAKQRLEEMETLTSALSDMCALDHALKSSVERGEAIDKAQFGAILNTARQSREATAREVDLLFDVFDKIKDGTLTANDFAHYDRKSLR